MPSLAVLTAWMVRCCSFYFIGEAEPELLEYEATVGELLFRRHVHNVYSSLLLLCWFAHLGTSPAPSMHAHIAVAAVQFNVCSSPLFHLFAHDLRPSPGRRGRRSSAPRAYMNCSVNFQFRQFRASAPGLAQNNSDPFIFKVQLICSRFLCFVDLKINSQRHGRPPLFVFRLSCSLPYSWFQLALASKSTRIGTVVAVPSVQL
jgi:hypothetical protein